ncbi:MAG: uroporphyrinogen decarboxylase family protein [Saccharofermentanales bacterium]
MDSKKDFMEEIESQKAGKEYMTPRERVLTALSHKEPDRVPYEFSLEVERVDDLQKAIGTNLDFRRYYKNDIQFAGVGFPEDTPYSYEKNNYTPVPEQKHWDEVAVVIDKIKKAEYMVCNEYFPGVYETVKEWFGTEETLMMMFTNPRKLRKATDKVADWLGGMYEKYVNAGIDMIFIGDDIGTQRSLIMSINDYRIWYKPHHKEIIARVKKLRPDIPVAFHCCGHLAPLIPEFIDIGVDIAQTIQPEADNDLAFFKKEYGADISFWGGVGMQSVFNKHQEDEIVEDVCRVLRTMSKNGGYILAPSHRFTREVDQQIIETFIKVANLQGFYPTPGSACSPDQACTPGKAGSPDQACTPGNACSPDQACTPGMRYEK